MVRFSRGGRGWDFVKMKSLFRFSLKVCVKISHSEKNAEIYHKCTLVFMRSARHYCKILMKFEFFRRIFEQSSNTKCHANPFIGRRFAPWGKTDETKLRVIGTIRNVANVPKN